MSKFEKEILKIGRRIVPSNVSNISNMQNVTISRCSLVTFCKQQERNLRPCLQAGRVTLVLGLPQRLVMALLGTTRLPRATLFWLSKAKYDHNTDKISKL